VTLIPLAGAQLHDCHALGTRSLNAPCVSPSPRLLVEGQKNGTLVLKAQGVGGLKEATAGFADELVRKEPFGDAPVARLSPAVLTALWPGWRRSSTRG